MIYFSYKYSDIYILKSGDISPPPDPSQLSVDWNNRAVLPLFISLSAGLPVFIPRILSYNYKLQQVAERDKIKWCLVILESQSCQAEVSLLFILL